MNEHPNNSALQCYLDEEEMDPSERSRLEAHLRRCGECRNRLEEYRELLASVGDLPTEADPGIDLWPAIASRIREAKGTRVLSFDPSIFGQSSSREAAKIANPGRAGSWRWRGVVAGGAIAATLAIGIALGRQLDVPRLAITVAGRDSNAVGTSGPATGPGTPTSTAEALIGYDESTYQQAIIELETLLRQNGAELQPETVATVIENLEIIDLAIAASRQAINPIPRTSGYSSISRRTCR